MPKVKATSDQAPAPASAPAPKRKSTPKKKATAPPQPKVMHFNGVPYLTLEKEEGNSGSFDVFAYKPSSDTSPLIPMGSYNSVSKEFLLNADWKETIQEPLALYRKGLKEKAEAAMEKAYELQGVPNPKYAE